MKQLTLLKLTTLAATLIVTTQALAYPGGITGRSANPDQGGKDCWGCHAKPRGAWVPPYTAVTSISGPQNLTVRPGAFADIKVTLESNGPAAGFNLSKTAGQFIDLTDINAQDQYTRVAITNDGLDTESTQNATTPIIDSVVSWITRWQAPEVEGDTTFYVCVNPVSNAEDGTAGDGAPIVDACINQVITVVAGENTAPVAAKDAGISLDQDTPTEIAVLSNDSDDIQLLASTLEIEQVPAHGNVSVDLAKGTVTYLPAVGYSGTDSFTYTVADGEGARSEAAEVELTVILTSGAPIIFNSEYNTFADVPLAIDVLTAANTNSSVPFAASDIEIIRANNGTVTIQEDGSLSYVANADFKGIDSFSYVIHAKDSAAISNEATVFITVTEKMTVSSGGSIGSLVLALLATFGLIRRVNTRK